MREDLRLVGRFLVFVAAAFLTAAALGAAVRIFLIVSGLGA
jgi:hypothetical protein